MKNLVRVLTVFFIISIIAPLLAGCDREIIGKRNTNNNKIKIGVSLPTSTERWDKDKESIELEAKKLSVELIVKVANNYDAKQQADQCDEILKQNVKVLILAPCDATASADIVQKAHAAGVQVIAYDGLINNSDVDMYISFDNEKVGQLQAEYLVSKMPSGNYVVLSGDPKDNNAKMFKAGAMKVLQPLVDKGNIKIVYDQACNNWEATEAAKNMTNAMAAQNNNIQAVLAPNDGTAGGVIDVLLANGMAGIVPVSGQDAGSSAVKRILKGTQSMTVFKDTRELGKAAFSVANKMAKGALPITNATVNNNKRDVPSILLPPDSIDKSNIMEMLIYSGYLKKGDISQ